MNAESAKESKINADIKKYVISWDTYFLQRELAEFHKRLTSFKIPDSQGCCDYLLQRNRPTEYKWIPVMVSKCKDNLEVLEASCHYIHHLNLWASVFGIEN